MLDLTVTPIHLNENATPEERALYAEVLRSSSVRFAARRIVELFSDLVAETVADAAVSGAVQAALKDGGHVADVLAQLQQCELDANDKLAHVREQRRAYKTKLEARRLETMPLLSRVTRELFDLMEQARGIEQRVAGFERSREANREQLKAAGITDSEIAVIGLKPTPADRAEWLLGLERIRAREARINAFLRSSPDYDESILAGPEASV